MKSFVLRCPVCGSDNLFPAKYAGRSLSCSHCGESLPVSADEAEIVVASSDTPARETGLRRLSRSISQGLCLVCFLVLGAVGGGWAGLFLAFRLGFLGYLLALITCPAGGLLGLWLGRWLGGAMGRLLGSYRLSLPGMLVGFAAGILYWAQSVESSYSRLMAIQLAWDDWLLLSSSLAIGGVVLGLLAMIVDALLNFTR